MSASLWGCELKYQTGRNLADFPGQPPCEAVSWNVFLMRYALESPVSLLVRLWVEISFETLHVPPLPASASLWGCELKYQLFRLFQYVLLVSLLVRLWVEILVKIAISRMVLVSLLVRLWVEMLSISSSALLYFVSLLVRLWVEICIPSLVVSLSGSASLWGCELKCSIFLHPLQPDLGQPPCEAVSWNVATRILKTDDMSQPPCEAVSWNIFNNMFLLLIVVSLLVRLWVEILWKRTRRRKTWSASLWGCELKSLSPLFNASNSRQPPCEAVSWNKKLQEDNRDIPGQPPCEAVSWNISA